MTTEPPYNKGARGPATAACRYRQRYVAGQELWVKEGEWRAGDVRSVIPLTSIMSTSWENLIEELNSLQHQFIEVAQQIEKPKRNNPGVCGSWSPKQVVVHITGWDKEVIRQFGLFQDGLEKAIEHNIDEFNKKSVLERNHLSWEEILTELQQAHEQFYRKAMSISSQELSKNEEYRDWVEIQIDHYIHHTKQLKKWV